MIRYAKPKNLDEALALLGEAPWRILAGGTDFYPALGKPAAGENVLDINGLDELRGISETASHIVIGARTTWTDLIRHTLPPAFDALKQAAREVGSVQIQNMASVAGNLCNASPAADGVPPLMILDAEVELRSAARRPHACRSTNSSSATAAPRLRPDEMVTAIRIPKASATGRFAFQKLGARRYLVISIAMAAARIAVGAGRCWSTAAAIAVGSCSAVAQRLPGLEASLLGLRPGPALAEAIAAADLGDLSPIDDVRGTADYRREAAREIVRRAVHGRGRRPPGRAMVAA